jgi:hypothetical protein
MWVKSYIVVSALQRQSPISLLQETCRWSIFGELC